MRTNLLTRIVLTVFLSSLLTASAWAEETSSGVLVPDLTGRSEQEAVEALDALGLEADVVTVAGDCPHRIIAHLPEAGVALERGGTVRLEVCIPVAVVTQAPDVVGDLLDDVHEALDAVYFLETDFVTDRDEPPGTVVAQAPEAGADLPFRGRFRLTVTAKVVQLPTVLGLHAQDATALLEADGLSVRIVGIESTEEEAGTVVSQMPRRGADVLPGTMIVLGVAGRPEEMREVATSVDVPYVIGLDMKEAYKELIQLGLVPHTAFTDVRPEELPVDAWGIVEQHPEADFQLTPGSEVSLVVYRPEAQAATIRVPNLMLLSQEQAAELLTSLGLGSDVDVASSTRSAGMVLGQDPLPGEAVERGARVRYTVSRPPVSSHPSRVRVPDLRGRDLVTARLALLRAGLRGRLIHRMAPGQPLRRVVAQTPRRGTPLTLGDVVTLVVPSEASVPPLQGLSAPDAVRRLEDAGFEAEPQGPPAAGPTRVLEQSFGPGTPLARGTRVAFTYVARGGPALVRVPQVATLRLDLAQAELAAAGLGYRVGGPAFGLGQRLVVAQTPAAGTALPRGAEVHLQTRWSGGGAGLGGFPGLRPPSAPASVKVPDLRGLTVSRALRSVTERGLQIDGRHLRHPGMRVVAQDPPPHRRVPRGTRIRVELERPDRPPAPSGTIVPRLVGHEAQAAAQLLAQRGLRVRYVDQRPGAGPATVRRQHPAVGRRVPPNSIVTLALEYRNAPPAVTAVPVPSVVGMEAQAAMKRLKAAGLQGRIVSSGTRGKIVLRQAHAGEQVPLGTTIQLLVGRDPRAKPHKKPHGSAKGKRPR